ncbi:M23/M56 family metallopeptidase [Maricaulis parjimensis]|uniref:M23/M56 family metallopeptidase n=1 Tax=Maricaulis parjimensis TaxID=144023 RepID=UPI001939D256|nr:M23/M56 family metallopeptidase [Maricaulis parjimensis]
MNTLLQALMTGAGLSLLSGLAAWLLVRALRHQIAGAEVSVWRMARLVALLPLGLAPLIYLVPQSLDQPAGPGLFLPPVAQSASAVVEASPAGFSAPGFELPMTDLALAVYLAGLATMLIACISRHLARRALLARSREASHEERRPFEAMARRIGVRAPELRIGPAGVSPFLTGWRGVVVLPDDPTVTAEGLTYAMAHELCHLRRGDERDRLIGSALLALAWFHWPLRQIERELDAAREMACDRDTLKALGGAQRKAYAAALIDMMRTAAPAVSAFGPSNRRLREMRIKAIMTQSAARKGRAVWLAATVLATAVPIAGAQALVTERRTALAPHAVHLTEPELHAHAPHEPRPELAAEPAVEPVAEPAPLAHAEPAPVQAPHPAHAPSAPHAVHAENVVFGPSTVSAPQDAHAGHASFGAADAVAPSLTHAVAQGRISSAYGPRPSRPAGAPHFHHGYDIAAERGTPIVAPGAGVVVHAEAGFRGQEAWGNTVAIDHGNGWQTVYAHMEGFDVSVGDQVMAGEQIGRVGATGRATGPHVHVELHHNGERVDPSGYVPGLN